MIYCRKVRSLTTKNHKETTSRSFWPIQEPERPDCKYVRAQWRGTQSSFLQNMKSREAQMAKKAEKSFFLRFGRPTPAGGHQAGSLLEGVDREGCGPMSPEDDKTRIQNNFSGKKTPDICVQTE